MILDWVIDDGRAICVASHHWARLARGFGEGIIWDYVASITSVIAGQVRARGEAAGVSPLIKRNQNLQFSGTKQWKIGQVPHFCSGPVTSKDKS